MVFDYGFRLSYGFHLCIQFDFEVSIVEFELALGCGFRFGYGFQLWVSLCLLAFISLCDCVHCVWFWLM